MSEFSGDGGNPRIPKSPIEINQYVPFPNWETKAQKEVTGNKDRTQLLALLPPPSPTLTFGANEVKGPQSSQMLPSLCTPWSSILLAAVRLPLSPVPHNRRSAIWS